MEGTVIIEDFKIHCVIGAHPHERGQPQELLVDIEMRCNFSECVQTDSIADTVDYEKVCTLCQDLAQNRRYHLIETFAYEALHAILDTFSLLWVKIRVKKKQALPLANFAIIELEKERE